MRSVAGRKPWPEWQSSPAGRAASAARSRSRSRTRATRSPPITAATTPRPREFTDETGIPVFKFDVARFRRLRRRRSTAIEAELGPVEVLVNNAGITRDATMHRMSFEQWDAVIQTNLVVVLQHVPRR